MVSSGVTLACRFTISVPIGAANAAFGGTPLTEVAERTVWTSANQPVPTLQAPGATIGSLVLWAISSAEAGIVVPFPQFARNLHSSEDYLAEFPPRNLAAEPMGLGLTGPERWVNLLTGSLKLLC